MDETEPIVPGPPIDVASPAETPPPAPDDAPRRRRSRAVVRAWVAVGIVAVLSVSTLVAAAFVQVPYFLISPGSSRPTEPLITIEDAQTFTHDGQVEFTTVSLKHATALEAVMGWLDPTVDVVDEDVILGGRTQEQNRQDNLQEMVDSKQVASAVALEELGYDVIKGTGAVVRQVVPDSPAAAVLQPDQVIVEANGRPIRLSSDLADVTRSLPPGSTLALKVEPAGGGAPVDVSATLAPRPDDPSKGLLGVSTTTRDLSFDFPFPVTIDSGDVGGPSAGLAFTLGVLDLLTPKSITGGRRVATTGTIDPNGFVGPVGGVEQKTVAVRRSGAELFLVPSSEVDEARRFAGDMRVEPVDTLDQALQVLSSVGGGTQALASASSPTGG